VEINREWKDGGVLLDTRLFSLFSSNSCGETVRGFKRRKSRHVIEGGTLCNSVVQRSFV
jgi:hypothetical protein